MVDLEGPSPHSAAVLLANVSRYHCGQVGCCFGLRIVLCWRSFVVSSALTPIFNCFCNFVKMMDLEAPLPHSATDSLDKVRPYHCGQVGCCFGLRIVLCLHFLWFLSDFSWSLLLLLDLALTNLFCQPSEPPLKPSASAVSSSKP
jgi:hypothetical protein